MSNDHSQGTLTDSLRTLEASRENKVYMSKRQTKRHFQYHSLMLTPMHGSYCEGNFMEVETLWEDGRVVG